MKSQIIDIIEREKIIVVARGIEKDKILPLAEALYNGGIRLIEIPFSADKKFSDEETAEKIRVLCQNYKGKMVIGAGTVLNKKQVKIAKKAGVDFIISPNTDKSVIKSANKNNLVSIAGALTPTEIVYAKKLKADFIKLFPIESMGTEYVKAISLPLSNVKLLAVGGINLSNIKDYLNSGVIGFGISASILNKELILKNDYVGISQLAKKHVDLVK